MNSNALDMCAVHSSHMCLKTCSFNNCISDVISEFSCECCFTTQYHVKEHSSDCAHCALTLVYSDNTFCNLPYSFDVKHLLCSTKFLLVHVREIKEMSVINFLLLYDLMTFISVQKLTLDPTSFLGGTILLFISPVLIISGYIV